MSGPVAIVTGAASGIGLAVTRHLLSKGYRVALADINTEEGQKLTKDLGPKTMFKTTDVSKYQDQAKLFSEAFKWGDGRLDFFAANAGTDDKQSLYEANDKMPLDEEGLPKPLDVRVIDVNLNATLQGIWLFKYFARQNKTKTAAKIVITASAAGIYKSPTLPIYCASKHGLVGLTRSAAPMLAPNGITINCICPAVVPTNLAPKHLLEVWPPEHLTPMTTVIKAYDIFLTDDSITGQIAELTKDEIHMRKQPDFANESQRWINNEAGPFWEKAYGAMREEHVNAKK